jgi:putative ABC transporter-associated repeat protein
MRATAAAGWVATLTLLACAPAAGVARAEPVVLADGHVDYAARMVDGELRSQIKDGTQGADHVVWRDPASVVFKVVRAAKTTVPSNSAYAFLGAPGSAVWMIPQVQKTGILWAGWNTEELTASDVSGSIAWTLHAVQGPGRVAVFQTGPFGAPDVIFNSGDGLPDQRTIPTGVHAHANWAFNQPGTYQLIFEMSATRSSGAPMSDTRTLTVLVEGDPGPVAPGDDGGPPADQPGGPSTPSAGATSPGATSPGGAVPERLTLSAGTPHLKGRTLTLAVRVNVTARVHAAVKRSGRIVARARVRTVEASSRGRTLRVRLGRALKPGRYRIDLRARANGETVIRTVALRVSGER